MFKLLKTLFFGKEREVPEGYVLRKNVMGREIEALYVVERNGHSREMRESEIYSWRKYFEE